MNHYTQDVQESPALAGSEGTPSNYCYTYTIDVEIIGEFINFSANAGAGVDANANVVFHIPKTLNISDSNYISVDIKQNDFTLIKIFKLLEEGAYNDIIFNVRNKLIEFC
ncbi:hypothetical protein CCP3SC1AL1_4200002 [Gammaproteobacteria bacterium]